MIPTSHVALWALCLRLLYSLLMWWLKVYVCFHFQVWLFEVDINVDIAISPDRP